MGRPLPIGIDSFAKLRSNGYYYVDKSLMIRDFIEMQDEVALIARPRRFGKTLNMTMIREFFDITKDNGNLFEGLAIMNSPYKDQIQSRPVIYFTFKNCKGTTPGELMFQLRVSMQEEYSRYDQLLEGKLDRKRFEVCKFYETFKYVMDPDSPYIYLSTALLDITRLVAEYYQMKPILLIDEYDQPIMSSYEYGYHEQLGTFFSNFYGGAMKGNEALGQALLTGVQRVAKESIFSQFNNPKVYTAFNRQYSEYFGLTEEEVTDLLAEYGLKLDEAVRKKYDGYQFGGKEIYNPWSILNYADNGFLDNYWVNSSSNYLVRQALSKADKNFWDRFDRLAAGEEAAVWLTLDTAYVERDSNYSLWGLLVNAGYLAVVKRLDAGSAVVRIPNEEVMSEFQTLVSELSGIDRLDLLQMFDALLKKDMNRFFSLYENIVISCTSYMDAKENAYHMLFLGMCITLQENYKVTSNIEAGYGRSDITLKAIKKGYPSIIVEFKQGEDIESLKEAALNQILEKRYYTGLTGEVVCVGIAHDKKRCGIASTVLELKDRDI